MWFSDSLVVFWFESIIEDIKRHFDGVSRSALVTQTIKTITTDDKDFSCSVFAGIVESQTTRSTEDSFQFSHQGVSVTTKNNGKISFFLFSILK